MGSCIDSVRRDAAMLANSEDAELWRWFSELLEDRRLRYCNANGVWLVTVDHRHCGTGATFDCAVRQAKERS